MAATAESMIASLDAGPSEGGGEAPASEPALISDTPASVEAPAQETSPSAAPAGGEPAQLAAAAAPAAPKDTPEVIERKHLAALHEARGENKTLRQQLAEMQQQIAALQKPQGQQPAAQPEQEPDFLADPKGYVDRVDKKVSTALEKLDKATQETAEQIKQREANEAVLRATQSAETEFYSKTPDYPQALQHIRGVRTQQLQALHPEATPEQISNHIAFEERETARVLVQQGRNPAEFAYNIARTLGYAKAAPPADPKPQPKPIDKDAVRTLGSGGGSGAPTEDAGNTMPEFSAALAERFKPRKR